MNKRGSMFFDVIMVFMMFIALTTVFYTITRDSTASENIYEPQQIASYLYNYQNLRLDAVLHAHRMVRDLSVDDYLSTSCGVGIIQKQDVLCYDEVLSSIVSDLAFGLHGRRYISALGNDHIHVFSEMPYTENFIFDGIQVGRYSRYIDFNIDLPSSVQEFVERVLVLEQEFADIRDCVVLAVSQEEVDACGSGIALSEEGQGVLLVTIEDAATGFSYEYAIFNPSLYAN